VNDLENQSTKFNPQPIRFRDCMSGGWLLFRKNWLWVIGFCVSLHAANLLRTWLFQKLFDAGVITMPSAASTAATYSGQLATAFVQFAVMVFIVAKSLLMLRGKAASISEILRGNFSKLIKIWLVIQLITLGFPFLLGLLYQLLVRNPPDIPYGLASVAFFVVMLISYLWLAITMAAQVIQVYLICHIVDGNGDDVVWDSLSMAKRTFIKLLLFFLLYIAVIALLSFPGWPLERIPRHILPYLQHTSSLLIRAMLLFQVTFLTVLYANSPRPTISVENDEDEDFAPDIQDEIAAAANISDTFRYRVEPSLNFADVGEFRCGLSRVRCPHKGRWGYADTNGQLVIDFSYKEAGDFHEGIAVVKEGKYEYYIDNAGERVINTDGYDQADRFNDGLAVVKIGFDWGVIDREGDFRDLPYEDVYSFNEGMAVVHDGKKWLYINRNLKPAFPSDYDDVWSFYDGLAMVEKNGKLGYIDTNGILAIPLRYSNALSFSEGLAAVMTIAGGKWGYIDRNGREVIPATFDSADSFQHGRAVVCVDGKYGHIDTEGAFINPPEYEYTGAFSGGFAVARTSAKDFTQYNAELSETLIGSNAMLIGSAAYGYVDMNGNECDSFIYQETRPFSEGFAWVKMDSGWGILETVSG
jgi:hypothetical protein